MSQNSITWCWRLGLASSLAAFSVISSFGDSTLAQVTPDVKLGVESAALELLVAQAAPPPPPPAPSPSPIPNPTPIPPPSTLTATPVQSPNKPGRPKPSSPVPPPQQP